VHGRGGRTRGGRGDPGFVREAGRRRCPRRHRREPQTWLA